MRTKSANNPKLIAIQLINHLPQKKMESVIDFLQYIAQTPSASIELDETPDVKSMAQEIRAGLADVEKIKTGKTKARSARDFLNAI